MQISGPSCCSRSPAVPQQSGSLSVSLVALRDHLFSHGETEPPIQPKSPKAGLSDKSPIRKGWREAPEAVVLETASSVARSGDQPQQRRH